MKSEPKNFEVDDIKLKGQIDMLVDDSILLFRAAPGELEDPLATDVLYLKIKAYKIASKNTYLH